ncbi:MAG TPA: SGNH/GDSL hydrolase family protein [Gemmatimonadales bacterium]|nr:SGNH/GDSL hydrolase family protein [Gemmatimonadales bacterium]
MIKKLSGLTLLAGALLVGACHEDGTLNPPATPAGGELMARYVAMGNSITAGYQSAGINDSTQRQSYAYLIAQSAGAPYYYQRLQGRGCAPPFTNNVTQARVGGGTAGTCDLVAPSEKPWLSNVAVPGARMEEATTNFDSTGGVPTSASNPLTTFILGGKTQADVMEEANPTLVTVWLGNNDVLGSLTSSANPGTPLLVTPTVKFQQAFDALAARLDGTGAKVMVIGAADVTAIPYSSYGYIIWCAKTGLCGSPAAPLPPTFIVSNNCAPDAAVPGAKGDSILVPWTKFVPLIGAAAAGATDTLDCSVDANVVTPSEYATLRTAVSDFNAYMSVQAAAHGYDYWDPNPTLLALKGTGQVPVFPDLSALGTGGSVGFGTYFSLDGVHPSATGQKLIADSVAAHLNAAFGTTIPTP